MTTTERLLAVLSALQEGRSLTGPQLADRFGVTVRTVRRDVDRLRELGYAIDADQGATGGYRLGAAGSAMPPLMLDEDEAVALAVCVRAAAGDSVTGIADAAARALAKLEQSIPTERRAKVTSLVASTVRLPAGGEAVDPDVLLSLSSACRIGERVRIHYVDARGNESDRRVEPYKVVNAGRRWYLVGYDLDRADWRTLRLDRIVSARPTGHGVGYVDPPDAAEYVRRSIASAPYHHQARIELDMSLESAVGRFSPAVGVLETGTDGSTILTTGADHLDWLVVHLGALGVGFRVIEPAELRDRLVEVGERLTAAGRG